MDMQMVFILTSKHILTTTILRLSLYNTTYPAQPSLLKLALYINLKDQCRKRTSHFGFNSHIYNSYQ